jgi:hypothetical protein
VPSQHRRKATAGLGEFCAEVTVDDSPKRGRPPKPAGEKLDAALHVKMTAAQRALIDQAADGDAATWARDVLLRSAKRKVGAS